MQDLTLNFEDKTIENKFLAGKRLIMQQVQLALQCWTGDWFFDGSYGIPYGKRLENKSILIADIEDIILSVDGVQSVQDINVDIKYGNNTKRNQKYFDISALIITKEEEDITLNGLVEISGV